MIQRSDSGVILLVRAQPNSNKNEIVGPYNGALKIKIKAPPVDGKANEELCNFLAKILGVAKRNITVEKGDISKNKKIQIEGLSLEEIKNKLKI